MNLRDALEVEHSKAQTLKITAHIGGSRKRFGELVAIVTGDDAKLAQRGAWVVSHCAEDQPKVVRPYLGELLTHLRRPGLHDAIKRNVMKAAAELDLPDEVAGLAADVAFDLLGAPGEAAAVKVYSMSVLAQVCRREPELADELRLHIENQLPTSDSPAFRSRARAVLRALGDEDSSERFRRAVME